MPLRAAILAIGDELLSGETVDTNSSYLDGLLEGWGWTVVRHATVPDELEVIARAFQEESRGVELLLSTGGLGPTGDDLTLAALARALGVELVLHEPTLEAIRERFRGFGREMTPNNVQQAMVPGAGEVLANQAGTAPGFAATLHGAAVYLMPGVPREVRWLMTHQIGPRIPRGEAVVRRTVKVVGLGESKLEHEIRAVVAARPGIRWGYRTLGAENHIKLLARGPGGAEQVAEAQAALQAVLGPRIFGADADELPRVVGAALAVRGATVAAAESCTGGLISKLLTDFPGSSAYVRGGVVAYANEAKVELLGVAPEALAEHGAVSEVVAQQMAEGARRRFGATFGLSTTGVAGPDGGSVEKPVGTVWVGLAHAAGCEARLLRVPGDRGQVRMNAALLALDLLRQRLRGS